MALNVNGRTTAEAIARGWSICKVEQTLGRTFVKKDAFGFGDFLAAVPGEKPALIQATSTGNIQSRIKKILDECKVQARGWLSSNGSILVWGWTKYKKPIDRKWVRLTEYEIKLTSDGELEAVPLREGRSE